MLLTKTVGVLLGVVFSLVLSDQSESSEMDIGPMGQEESLAGKRRIETPEVVLQLKYDKGELNRIYLAQFRKGKSGWTPSVSARNDLCSDLCHAGDCLFSDVILCLFFFSFNYGAGTKVRLL
jgi:hypothetical protein